MAVLGLLVEQKEATVSQLGKELHRRFRRSRFSRSTAQNAMDRFVGPNHQWACLVVEGSARSLNCYAPSKKGEDIFSDWMRCRPGDDMEPRIRDAMYGRLELCKDEYIPILARLAWAEVAVSEDLYNAASKRKNTHLTRKIPRENYTERARHLLLYIEPKHWATRGECYEQVALGLEEILADMRADGVQLAEVDDG
jgi:hypothetical protein